MPIHDWTREDAGTFHNFHQDWTIQLYRALNAGRLPPGYLAMTEQRVEGWEPDVISLHARSTGVPQALWQGGVAVAERPPQVRSVSRAESEAGVNLPTFGGH